MQGDRVAVKDDGGYRVVWARDGNKGNEGSGSGEGFLGELRDRDRLLVWARAKWIGWQCIVESVKGKVTFDF